MTQCLRHVVQNTNKKNKVYSELHCVSMLCFTSKSALLYLSVSHCIKANLSNLCLLFCICMSTKELMSWEQNFIQNLFSLQLIMSLKMFLWCSGYDYLLMCTRLKCPHKCFSNFATSLSDAPGLQHWEEGAKACLLV